jgi:gluconolactonase
MRGPHALVVVLAAATAASGWLASSAEPRRALGSVERKDPRLDRLVPKDARLEVLAEGFSWTEGPVWDRKAGRLLFTDIPANAVHAWSEAGALELFLKPSGYTGSAAFTGREPGANGLAFDAQGRLVLCQHGDRRISRLEADGSFTTLADRYDGKRFNSPNDLVYASNGDLYFTDPPYGLPKTFEDPARELPFCGVYRLAKGGKVELLVRDLKAPNGIALSPDEKTLYVAQSDPSRAVYMAYDRQGDGRLANGRVLFDATPWVGKERPGLPDGLKVDREGNLFATGPGGVHVFTAAGEHLGTLATGVPTANCAFGDDGKTLYVTANRKLARIRLTTTGLGFE